MSDLERIVAELLMLFHESARYHQNPSVRAVLEDARIAAAAIHRRLMRPTGRYVVAIVGLSNVGKSTLLNAMLGAALAPHRNGPCTGVPVEFCHGSELRVIAHYEILRKTSWVCAHEDAVHDRLDRLSQSSSERPMKVEVQIPCPLLEGGLVLADTPGFGAAEPAGPHAHDEVLKRYLRDHVSQVLWVVLGDLGISQTEMGFYDRFFADLCDDVVVTGDEDWELADQERFRGRFAQEFGPRRPAFHFVSTHDAANASSEDGQDASDRSRVSPLADRLRVLASPTEQHGVAQRSLEELAQNVGTWLEAFRDAMGAPLTGRWRPDSWDRWATVVPGDTLKSALDAALGDEPLSSLPVRVSVLRTWVGATPGEEPV